MFLYSSMIKMEINTASQTIKTARISITASVRVSNCTGGRLVNAEASPFAAKRDEVKMLSRKTIMFAASSPAKWDFKGNFLISR